MSFADRTGASMSRHLRSIATGAVEFDALSMSEMKEGDNTPGQFSTEES